MTSSIAAYRCNAIFLMCVVGCTTTAPQDTTKGNSVQTSAPGAAQCFTSGETGQAAGVQATNAARARAGLNPVQANSRLASAAAAHACDMAERGRMTHTGTRSSGPGQRVKSFGYAPRVTAENIAAGPLSEAQALAAWNGSSGHLQNMLIPQLRDVGIGRAIGSDGRTVFWAAVYAAPQ